MPARRHRFHRAHHASRGVRVGGLALLVVASAALVALPAMPASAHNYLGASSPAEGEVVTGQPGVISLETNDELLDVEGGAVIQVQGPDGRYYGDGCTEVVGVSAQTIVQLGTPGAYTVTWRVVSTDGHPISGTWAFDWQPAEGVVLAEGSTEPGSCGGDAVVSTPGAATDEPTDEATEEPADASSDTAPLDALWVAGGVLLAAVAALGTWLMVRRRT
jgi:copper resistance protein C